MARTIVGILRGGPSSEYNLSLKTGAAMQAALPEEHYDVCDIFIDKRGVWHARGLPVEPLRAISQLDVVLNGLHGGVGEDGTIQRILERASVAYTGSRARAAALSLNKIRARVALLHAGVRMPNAVAFTMNDRIDTGEMAREAFSAFAPPYIVKPASEGAGHGLRIAAHIGELPEAIADVLDEYGAAIVEEYLTGDEVSVGILEDFRGEELYALPPAHVVLPDGARFFHPEAHEHAQARHACPSNFTPAEKRAIEDLARTAHRALGLSHFSRSDIILTRHGPYLLEVNALPGLYAGSSFPQMLDAVGSSVREFLEHSMRLARR